LHEHLASPARRGHELPSIADVFADRLEDRDAGGLVRAGDLRPETLPRALEGLRLRVVRVALFVEAAQQVPELLGVGVPAARATKLGRG
jgi:hypothetical protein